MIGSTAETSLHTTSDTGSGTGSDISSDGVSLWILVSTHIIIM